MIERPRWICGSPADNQCRQASGGSCFKSRKALLVRLRKIAELVARQLHEIDSISIFASIAKPRRSRL
jgi:hypothetical protein